MNPITLLARAASAMLLLCACAGVQAQGATALPQSRAAPAALALNDAAFVSQSVPMSMTPSAAYNVSVTMKNAGSATWSAGATYRLGSQNPRDNTLWGTQRAVLAGPVLPGGLATFSFQVTAPATSGTYGFQWQMVQEYVAWFGAATPNVVVTVGAAAARNDAQVIGQSAPPQMTSGKNYTVSVTLKNTGTTTWKSADAYMLGAQNPADNHLWNGARVALGATVTPGQQYTFTFPVTAPAPGSYSMQWKMLRESVEWFGAMSSSPVTVAAAPGSDVVTYIHTDALGSPVARSDAAGNIISRTRYEPYGGTASGVTPTIGFTGHVNDADTGLVYMQQRYYDPVAGRFLSIDPVTTDANSGSSFNRYAYADNSPYRYIDPDGRQAIKVLVEIFKAVVKVETKQVAKEGAKQAAKGATKEAAKDVAKTVPNPYGRSGGPAHQEKVAEVAKDVESRGLTVEKEMKVATPGGHKETRFVDVAGRDAEGKVTEMHQVGRHNQNGTPVSRETKALNDVEGRQGSDRRIILTIKWREIVGHQVNFFLTQKDIVELQGALHKLAPLVILHSRSSTREPRILESLNYDESGKPWLYFCLARPQDLTKIVTTKVATQGYWTIDTTTAPVVEFHCSFFNGEVFRRGRAYFVDAYYGSDRELVTKSEDFLKWAQQVLSVIKRHLIKDGRNYVGADAKRMLAASRNIVIEE